jgi:hypothetical protein
MGNTNAIAQATGTENDTAQAEDEASAKKLTEEDIKEMKGTMRLLTSKLYLKADQESPSLDILATLTRHENGHEPEFIPVDYRLVTIPVIVHGHECTALFDSGSSITIAPIALAEILGIKVEDSDKSIKSVTGHVASANKRGLVRLTMAGHTRDVEIHFTGNFLGTKNPYDLIIGVDTMRHFPSVTLNVQERKLTIGHNTLCWKTKGELLREERKVFVTHELVVPPNTQAVVGAFIDNSKGEVTPTVTIEKTGTNPIEVVCSLTDVDADNRCKLVICNPHKVPITIRPYEVIGLAANTIEDNGDIGNIPEITAAMAQGFKRAQDIDPTYVVDYSKTDCTEGQQVQLRKLLEKYGNAFSKNGYDLGTARVNPMQIRTTTDVPFRPSIYPTDRGIRDKVRQELEHMKDMGCIVESNTPWLSPLVMVKKKTGDLRPCIDLRKLNSITIPDFYPLPRVTDAIDRLSGSHWLTTLDLNKGFWQLPLAEDASWKCGIISENKVFQCKKMPFGLKNAPSAFTRAMDTVIGPLTDKCVVYIDDIVIMTKVDDFEHHLRDIEDVLKRFLLFDLKINPRKCEFARREITFLGHKITAHSITLDERNLVKIAELPTPQTQTDVRHCLGVFSFFRRLIPSYARIASPLTELCGKGTKFLWTTEQQKAFDKLKHILAKQPTIHFPEDHKDFHIFVDASKKAIGIALTQTDKDTEGQNPIYKPICFFSRALSKSEQKRPAVQLELTGLIEGFRKTKYYTYGHKVIIHTDHKPLIHLLAKSTTHPHLARWLIELQQYDNVYIRHIKGQQNTLADALSRLEKIAPGRSEEELEDLISGPFGLDTDGDECNALWTLSSSTTAGQHQRKDAILNEAIKAIERAQDPKSITDLEIRWYADNCELDNTGTLVLKQKEGEGTKHRRIIVPKALRLEVFRHYHTSMIGGGHMDTRRTCEKMHNYAWRGMTRDVAEWHKRCFQCQIRAPKRHKIPLVMTTNLTKPFQKLGIDICGPLHRTDQGYLYYLLIIDWYTKYAIAIPLKDFKSLTAIEAIWHHLILKYGTPQEIVTDNATTFTSKLFTEFMERLGIKLSHGTPYHSDGNAITERTFRTFHDIIAKYRTVQDADGTYKDWDRLLPVATFAYNVTKHSTTGETPFLLMHGRDPILPMELILHREDSPKEPQDIRAFRAELIRTVEALHERATENFKQSALRMKAQADKKCKDMNIKEGELVLYRDYSLRVGTSTKFKNPWLNVYRVRKIDGQHAWIVRSTQPNDEPKRVHLNQVKRFYAPVEEDGQNTFRTTNEHTLPTAKPKQDGARKITAPKKAPEAQAQAKAKRRGEGTKYNLRQFDKPDGGLATE